MCLFLRISKDQDWRLLAKCGVREVLCIFLKFSPSDITNITRTPTGFALFSKDEETRQKLLNNNEGLALQNAKLEPVSDLMTYRIATVPVALRTPNGTVIVEKTNLVVEITRVTNVIPRIVRQHGKTSAGAPYRSWLNTLHETKLPDLDFVCLMNQKSLFFSNRDILYNNVNVVLVFTLHEVALEHLPAKIAHLQCISLLIVRPLLGVAITEDHIDQICGV
ncbi:putative eka-like protein [Erysiphe necator]|uniref:Putative eka-like protein n=1 Tax=Uncinula necator TaxID=52586 RepID=A0A0B1P1Y5_UNCNE|nr:putative eka-like protein [Erysiphe necator]